MLNSCLAIVLGLALLVFVKCESYCGQYNCYELLGVDQNADENTIRKAFRELARKHHPDKNQQEDTTQLFQMINKAYQVLTDEKMRFKYGLHLQNPEESDYYHEYRYYSKKYIQDPQIHPAFVIIGLLLSVSLLQYVMRKQMYQRAILGITQSHEFRAKVNERCGNNKKIKDRVREQMIQEIEIEGGYSKPQWKDILICQLALLPYTLYFFLQKKISWFIKYTVQGKEFSKEDQQMLTIKALQLTPGRWSTVSQKEREALIVRRLWFKDNLRAYQQEMRLKYLEQLKSDKPHQYQMYIKYMKKYQ